MNLFKKITYITIMSLMYSCIAFGVVMIFVEMPQLLVAVFMVIFVNVMPRVICWAQSGFNNNKL